MNSTVLQSPAKPLKFVVLFGIICACLILLLNFGLRSSLGFFIKPLSETYGYGREVFAFALALQNLIWGLTQPVVGLVTDRFGVIKPIIVGTLLYAGGLYLSSVVEAPWLLNGTAGLLVGMGISATGFGVILPAMAKMVSLEKRSFILGLGTAAGSAGQFICIPVAREFIVVYGWQTALVILAGGALLMMFFSAPVAAAIGSSEDTLNSAKAKASEQTTKEALTEATKHIHYWLLIAGFFVCGFQLAFVTVHMPSYITDKGFDSSVAANSLAIIGFFNIFGSMAAGIFAGRFSKKWILGYIYAVRAIAITLFMLVPISVTSIYLFSMVTGLLWLATVPPTSGIVAQMFGLRYMGMLYGIVFLNHQLGSFLGVWLGGIYFDRTGSYDVIWWAAAVIAGVTAIIHIFINDSPVERLHNRYAAGCG